MSLLSGGATYTRFKVLGNQPRLFDEWHLDKLSEFAAGRQQMIASDGIEFGWSAGASILDTKFELEKNIINDALFFGLRIDQTKLPADLLKAYYLIDLEALSRNNPSGFASKAQKREAKESALDRLEQEAKDGRYSKRQAIEVMWDLRTGELLFGTNSATHVDRLATLFRNTFDLGIEAITANKRAQAHELNAVAVSGDMETIPSPFIPGVSPEDIAWVPCEDHLDYLGNELLLWLWYMCDDEDASIRLPDGNDATVLMSRGLTLECPRGQTGKDTISHEVPIRLPEALRAIQSGKLPRKTGLTVVRLNEQYELTLHAESLAISSAKFPAIEDEDPRARLDGRVQQLRDLNETLDLLFEAFCKIRFSRYWATDWLLRMQRWLSREGVFA